MKLLGYEVSEYDIALISARENPVKEQEKKRCRSLNKYLAFLHIK